MPVGHRGLVFQNPYIRPYSTGCILRFLVFLQGGYAESQSDVINFIQILILAVFFTCTHEATLSSPIPMWFPEAWWTPTMDKLIMDHHRMLAASCSLLDHAEVLQRFCFQILHANNPTRRHQGDALGSAECSPAAVKGWCWRFWWYIQLNAVLHLLIISKWFLFQGCACF